MKQPHGIASDDVKRLRDSQEKPVMSELVQKRRFFLLPITSGLPLSTDILRVRPHVSKVPQADNASSAFPLQRKVMC